MGKDKGGRGKGNSGRSAGRKLFIANEDELMLRNREVNEVNVARMRRRAGSDADDDNADDDDDDEEEEEGEVDGAGVKGKESSEGAAAAATVFGFQRMSRAEAAAANKLKGGAADEEAEEDEEQPRGLLAGKVNNPNRQPKPQEKMLKVKDLSITGDVVVNPEAGMSRKEREAFAAQKAKEDYLKRHMAGETEQARKDLERLAIVRKRREEAAQKRAAEGRPAGWTPTGIQSSDSDSDSEDDSDDDAAVNQKGPPKPKGPVKGPAPSSSAATSSSSSAAPVNKQALAIQAEEKALAIAVAAKKKAAALGEGESNAEMASDGGPAKLKSMDIKKMNGDQLKDHLKARKLDVQGQKKDLMKRLIDYEAARP